MKKNTVLIWQIVLLIWFFIDMTGLSLGKYCLVTKSYKDDGIFFLIYFATVILFALKENIGKWISIGWMSMWFITQFICHEWYTIFDGGFMGNLQDKIKYFSGTMQWIKIEGKYVPDIYHTLLHILILTALIFTIIYTVKKADLNDRIHVIKN